MDWWETPRAADVGRGELPRRHAGPDPRDPGIPRYTHSHFVGYVCGSATSAETYCATRATRSAARATWAARSSSASRRTTGSTPSARIHLGEPRREQLGPRPAGPRGSSGQAEQLVGSVGGGQRGDAARVVRGRDLDDVGAGEPSSRTGQPGQEREQLARRQPARLGRPGARGEGRVEHVDVEGDVGRRAEPLRGQLEGTRRSPASSNSRASRCREAELAVLVQRRMRCRAAPQADLQRPPGSMIPSSTARRKIVPLVIAPAEVGVPGVRVGVELEQRERAVGRRRRAQQRQGDRVVAAEAEDTCARRSASSRAAASIAACASTTPIGLAGASPRRRPGRPRTARSPVARCRASAAATPRGSPPGRSARPPRKVAPSRTGRPAPPRRRRPTCSSVGSRANVRSPAKRGTSCASTWPSGSVPLPSRLRHAASLSGGMGHVSGRGPRPHRRGVETARQEPRRRGGRLPRRDRGLHGSAAGRRRGMRPRRSASARPRSAPCRIEPRRVVPKRRSMSSGVSQKGRAASRVQAGKSPAASQHHGRYAVRARSQPARRELERSHRLHAQRVQRAVRPR